MLGVLRRGVGGEWPGRAGGGAAGRGAGAPHGGGAEAARVQMDGGSGLAR